MTEAEVLQKLEIFKNAIIQLKEKNIELKKETESKNKLLEEIFKKIEETNSL